MLDTNTVVVNRSWEPGLLAQTHGGTEMPKNFSTADAKALIAKHEELYQQLIEICDEKRKDFTSKVQRAHNEILSSQIFSDQIIDDLRRGVERIPRTFSTEALAAALCHYVSAKPLISETAQIRLKYERDVLSNLSGLRKATSKVRWLFSNERDKATAEEAYSRLQTLLNDEYGQTIHRCHRDLAKAEAVSTEVAFPDFEAHITEYKKAFLECLPNGLTQEGHFREIDTLLSKQKNVESRYNDACSSCQHSIDATERTIRKTVDVLLATEALKQLQEYDLETLNQKRSGIRTKPLRNAGYENIADIYSATASNLASINGISEESAYQIKRAASEIFESIRDGIHLKISTDDRSKEATNLIAALYTFKTDKSLLNDFINTLDALVRYSNSYSECLGTLRNSLCWIFSTEKQKSEYSHAFHGLFHLLAGPLKDAFDSSIRQINTPFQVTPDAVWQDFSINSISYFNTLEELIPGIFGNGDMVYGLPEDLAREIQDQTYFPQGLKVTLRRYQEWGVKYILHQEKALLGDEMGLGKTVQAIATMVSLRNTGSRHFLVVCPASVLPNWCKEIDKKSEFFPTKVHGLSRQNAINDWVKCGGVAVTTYETTGLISLPEGFQIDLLVVDEAHYIKNEGAQRSKNVRALGTVAKRILFMTGTALENNVNEMISLIRVLQPGIAAQAQNIAFMSSAPQFREQIAPVYYRRKREDVLTELPDITESKEWCSLLPAEEEAYETAVLNRNQAAIRKVSWMCDDLRQSSKARRMLEIISDAEEDNRKVLVFSFYLETIKRIRAFLGDRCTQPINGSVPVERRQQIIDEFESMPAGSVLLAQIQAGGTGLNIQSASVVIICEPQLKPSIENQAISRAYRMGQTRKVLVYRLLAADTIDERLDDLLEEKQAVFMAFADRSAAAEATQIEEQQIDDKTFGKLILEEIERIKEKNGDKAQNTDSTGYKPTEPEEKDEAPVEETSTSNAGESTSNTGESSADNEDYSAKEDEPPNDGKSPNDDKLPKEKGSMAPTKESVPVGESAFNSIDELITYLYHQRIHYVDNRPKNGCLWISADGFPRGQIVRVAGKKLMFSKASKALGGNAGWYIS